MKERNWREDKWIEGEGSVGGSSEGDGGGEETIVEVMGVRETGGKVYGGKAIGTQVSQEMGGKGDMLTDG